MSEPFDPVMSGFGSGRSRRVRDELELLKRALKEADENYAQASYHYDCTWKSLKFAVRQLADIAAGLVDDPAKTARSALLDLPTCGVYDEDEIPRPDAD